MKEKNKIALVAVQGGTFDYKIFENSQSLLEKLQTVKNKILSDGIFNDIVSSIEIDDLNKIDMTTLVQASSLSNRTEKAFLLYPGDSIHWNDGVLFFDAINDKIFFYENDIKEYIRRTFWWPKLEYFRPSIRFRGYGNPSELVEAFNKNHDYVHWHVYRGEMIQGKNFIEQGYSLRRPHELDWVYSAEKLSAWGWYHNRFENPVFDDASIIIGVADCYVKSRYMKNPESREIYLYLWEDVKDISQIIEAFGYWS